MARMIPDVPREFDPRSCEGLMFEELNKLSNDYYVFHSFSIVDVQNSVLRESEIDFVIFHPKKGIICLEAKAGKIDYNDGYWKYGSGIKMSHDGPYNQASANKWKLKNYMLSRGLSAEYERCKLLHAVWFPDVPKVKLMSKQLPSSAEINITLTSDSFGRIEECINEIFKIEIMKGMSTKLTDIETQRILDRVLAPHFNLISIHEAELERTKNVFKRMLREQTALLNYLDEQNNAIINGFAGTGKTVLAIEKARRHSEKDEKVLFLCYNSFLKEHLKTNYNYPCVSYYTIDGLACRLCRTATPNYMQLQTKLEEMYYDGSFPYQHVIIDEGQDFGKIELEEEEIIELLKMNALDNETRNGTFYLFYDKNQMVQSNKMPKYIDESECKLTLYRNCRNTENIALTSLRLLGLNQAPKLYEGGIKGTNPEFLFCTSKEELIEKLNDEIDIYIDQGYSDITILTCKTEESSIIAEYCDNSKYKYKRGYVRFTTCRKFKGLESDVIIVVDIDKSIFNPYGQQLMYVGASRARYKLNCLVNLNEEECAKIMEEKEIKKSRNTLKSFATAFNAKIRK